MGEVIYVDTDRFGRIIIDYNDKITRLTKKQFQQLLNKQQPMLVVDKPLDIPYFLQLYLKRPEYISQYRKKLKLKKNDFNDLKVLKYIYAEHPEYFESYTEIDYLITKYLDICKISFLKRRFNCWKEIKRELEKEVEKGLKAIKNKIIIQQTTEKIKRDLKITLNSLAYKLIVYWTIEQFKQKPNMSLNRYLGKIGLKGKNKKTKIYKLFIIAAHPIALRHKRMSHGRAARLLAYKIYHALH